MRVVDDIGQDRRRRDHARADSLARPEPHRDALRARRGTTSGRGDALLRGACRRRRGPAESRRHEESRSSARSARSPLISSIMNAEENRREDFDALATAGLAVFVTEPKTIIDGVRGIAQLGAIAGCRAEGEALAAGAGGARACHPGRQVGNRTPVRYFCPIWRKPWMTFNADTYAHDMLRAAGGANVCAAAPERYPTVDARSNRGCGTGGRAPARRAVPLHREGSRRRSTPLGATRRRSATVASTSSTGKHSRGTGRASPTVSRASRRSSRSSALRRHALTIRDDFLRERGLYTPSPGW